MGERHRNSLASNHETSPRAWRVLRTRSSSMGCRGRRPREPRL